MSWSPPASDVGWQPPESDQPKLSPEEEALNTQIGGETGAGEVAASVGSSVLSSLAPVYLGKSAMNAAGVGNGEDPLETKRRFEREHTYVPRTEAGQGALRAIGEGASNVGAAARRGVAEAADISSARFPSVANVQPPSETVTDVTKDVASRAGEVVNEIPVLGAAVKGVRRLFGGAEAAETAEAAASAPPPEPVARPLTAEDVRTGPERLTNPTPAPATQPAPAPTSPAAPVRVPVPGKPHITPKAAPAVPEVPTPGHPVTEAGGAVRYATAQELLEKGGTAPPAEAPAAAPAQAQTPSTERSQPAPASKAPEFTAPQQEGKASGSVSADEQGGRTDTLHDLNKLSGGRLTETRTSSITGGYDETKQDYQHAESPGVGGARMRGVIAGENEALTAASQRSVDETGGTAKGTQPAALQERGTVIDRALTGIRDWFDTNVGALYKGADKAAGGVPVTKMDSLKGVLSDPSRFTGAEGMQLHGDVTRMAQHFGLMGADGFWKPATVENVERFRSWVNDQYTPRTGKAVRALKNALDADVAAHGGADFYPKARALRQKQDAMIEGPKGIAKLIPEKNPDGTNSINRPVPIEGVADHIANLPKEQFDHIVNVLHDSGKLGAGELAEDSAAALREIKAHMAERMHEAGSSARDKMWDPYKYHGALSKYSLKMPSVFAPSEISRFQTINRAGNTLRMDKRYGGASAQAQIHGGMGLRERLGNAAESELGALLPPGINALGELTGASQKLRDAFKGPSGAKHLAEVETRITKLGEPGERPRGGGAPAPSSPAVTPLGQMMGGRQGGFIGTREQRATVKHATAPGVDEGGTSHTYSPPGGDAGKLRVEENPALGVRKVISATVHDKGKGWGTSMLARAAQDAHDKGQVLRSDSNVSLGQAGAYENLKKLGYDVVEKPNDERGGSKVSVGDHVFEVRPRAEIPTNQLGQRLYGGRMRGGPKFTPKAKAAPAAAEKAPAEFHEDDWLGAATPAKEAPVGRSMINVGLHQGDPAAGGRVIPVAKAQQALRDAGVPVHRWNVQQSGTEPTLVASLHRPATDAELHSVAEKLGQQAVSQRHPDGSGTMHGPGVDSQEAKEQGWDKFNGDYFRMHDGRTATEHVIAPSAEAKAGKQTVTKPARNAYPGIYDDPHEIISRLKVAPEDPILRQLFGVTRRDLSETALGREGNLPGTLPGAAPKPRGSKAADAVMTPKNENRLVGLLNAAKEYPDLHDGMTGWYGMDPLHDAFVKELGAKTGTAAYSRLNHFMGMVSPGSDVATEINRGTAANMLNEQGKLGTFLKQGGRPMGSPRRPAELANVSGHPYHSTAHGIPMREFVRTGNLDMGSPKVPLYIQASGVPETGFQTRTPVGDSHWSRGVGLSDVRTNQSFASSVTNPEMSQLGPWYRDKIAARAGLPAVSAQALQWGALGGETGVETAVGAPKLELFAQSVKKAAARAGVTPEEMLRRIIRGTAHAG